MPGRPADQKVKILYIEDNRENRMLVRAVLEAAGYAIVDAEDGLTGIEALHRSLQDITSEMGVAGMLEKLLGGLAQSIGTSSLRVELSEPPGVNVTVNSEAGAQPRSVLAGTGAATADDWTEVEWTLPLNVRGRQLGVMIARHVLPPGAKADEEQLLKIVADQVAIAVENARLYEGVMRRAAEQESLVESGRLLAGTLQVSEVLHRLSELVRSRFGADVARILIRDDAPGIFRLHAQAGTTRTSLETVAYGSEPDDVYLGWIVKNQKAVAYRDIASQPRVKYTAWLESEGFVSYLA